MKIKDLIVLLLACVLLAGLIVTSVLLGAYGGENTGNDYFVESDVSENFYIDGKKLSSSERSALAEEIASLMKEIENELSTVKNGSDISRINSAAAGEAVSVSPRMYELLTIAKDLYSLTEGAFSPALYNLSEIWGFTPNFQGHYGDSRREPDASEIVSALETSDFTDIMLKENNVVEKSNGSTKIDFGGLAKGYMCDAAAAFVRQKYAGKQIDGTISVMSNSIVFGAKPSGEGYTASVSDPRSVVTGGAGAAVVSGLSDVAISTSADTYRSYVFENKIYSHIIDPATGKPADNGIISITVIVPVAVQFAGTYADAFSTAGFCKPTLRDSLSFFEMLADKYNVGAVIITSDHRYYVTGGYTVLNPDEFIEGAVSAYTRTDVSKAPLKVIPCEKEIAYIEVKGKE